MRHTQLRLRADNEPALTTVVEAVNAVWPHFVRVDQRPLYSSALKGRTGHSVGATAGSGLAWSNSMDAGWTRPWP